MSTLYIVYVFGMLYSIVLVITEIRKVLTKIEKESNCAEINSWIRACENHLLLSATSNSNDDGKVILAKFLSFLGHIVDKHENLENPLFSKCAHDEIETRESLDERICIIRHTSIHTIAINVI